MTVASWASFMVSTGIDACCKNLLKEAEPREFARLPNALGGDSQTSGCLTPLRRKSNERLPNALAATIGSDAAALQAGNLRCTSPCVCLSGARCGDKALQR